MHCDGKGVALKGVLPIPAQVPPPAGKVPVPGDAPDPNLPAMNASPLVEQTHRVQTKTPAKAEKSRLGALSHRRAGGTKRRGGASEGSNVAGHKHPLRSFCPPLNPAAGHDVAASARAQRASAGSPTHIRARKH